MAIHSLARVEMAVPDVEATSRFYRDFGLVETRPGVFASASGGEQLFIEQAGGSHRELRVIGVGVDARSDADAIADRMDELDIPWSSVGDELHIKDPGSGVTAAIVIQPRHSHSPELHPVYNGPNRIARSGRAKGIEPTPARPRKLGHVVYMSPDVPATHRFWIEGVQVSVSDEIRNRAYFCSLSGDHHNLVFGSGPFTFMHHTAWELGDVDEIAHAANSLLTAHPDADLWGLGRHYVGSNIFWYFKDPAGNFVEYYSDIDRITSDWTAQVFDLENAPLATWGPPVPAIWQRPPDLEDLFAAHDAAQALAGSST
jgi:catechol 2,3-dioxygenase-like lactoylglutathione lyase family enzyme